MDPTTYGDFPAAHVLAERLTALDDPALTRRVTRFLTDFNTGLAALDAIEDDAYRGRLALLWRDHFVERLDFHPDVDSWVRNVLSAYYRDLL